MTIFRAGDAAPAWCELTGFELIELGLGEATTRTPDTPAERVMTTVGTVQLRRGDRTLLLKPGQFVDLDTGAGAWTASGHSSPASLIRLRGHWGRDLGGCGLFSVTRTEAPESKGDPVDYPKHTAIDSHYHDCDEYWIVLSGRGRAVVGGRWDTLGPGDCLCIGMGHHHDFPQIESEVRAVFFETTLEREKRTGHLWNHTHGVAVPHPERI